MKINKSKLKEIIKEELKIQEGKKHPLEELEDELGRVKARVGVIHEMFVKNWLGIVSSPAQLEEVAEMIDEVLKPAFEAVEELRILLQQEKRKGRSLP